MHLLTQNVLRLVSQKPGTVTVQERKSIAEVDAEDAHVGRLQQQPDMPGKERHLLAGLLTLRYIRKGGDSTIRGSVYFLEQRLRVDRKPHQPRLRPADAHHHVRIRPAGPEGQHFRVLVIMERSAILQVRRPSKGGVCLAYDLIP